MALISIYKGAVTAGTTNGTEVSSGGTFTAPVSVELDASQNESKIIPLAIRTASGYKTSGTTTIGDSGDINDRWKFSWSESGTYSDSISTAAVITASNVLFYAKATSADTELPTTDRSVNIAVNASIVATG